MPSLAKYRNMRDFEQTAEPRGGKAQRLKPAFSYVVQKHDARNLHYDFRLELDGVLLSWAVPKGPSLDPSVKRLAVETEPHPVEYGSFEGSIPEGEYGGGTVMVWDQGLWEPEGDPRKAYAKGRLSFELKGNKLKGAWHLVRTGRGGEPGKAWLLFKSRDEFAAAGENAIVEEQPDSALTGRSLTRIEAEGRPEAQQGSAPRGREKGMTKKPSASEAPAKAKSDRRNTALKGPKAALPAIQAPQLATLVKEAPSGEAWVHEIKLDGYRVLARVAEGAVTLLTRNGKDWTHRMGGVAHALKRLQVKSALLDGEVIVVNEAGLSDFQLLQNSLSDGSDSALVYYAFDLLHVSGRDLRQLSLLERKQELQQLLQENKLGSTVRFSSHVRGDGPRFLEGACKLGLEGIICKRGAAPYTEGRSRDWLKVKCSKRQELAVVGYTEPGGSRSHLGALLLGMMQDEQLVYAGRVGTGFTERSLQELQRRLEPLEVKEPQVARPPRGADARGVHWVTPKLVAEVSFTAITSAGLLRHPTFHGLRDDKTPSEVTLELPQSLERAEKSARSERDTKRRQAAPVHVNFPITNPTKVLYPQQGITKRELLDYYGSVAERMLPHIANRPLTLVRCPNGFGKPCFFQKHPGKGTPEGLRSISIREKEGKSPYSVLDDSTGLFGLVQLGALEIHTWGSHADDFEHPDLLVFDLDPDPELSYQAVIDCALRLREVFQSANLESFVKTTGGKGLHVCVPIVPSIGWEQAKSFSNHIADALVAESPNKYVSTVSKAERTGKIFIDYLRNGRGATFIAPYSTRNRENAPIAVPLEWHELSPKLKPDHFNLRNIHERLADLRQDPFERMATLKQELPSIG